MDKDFRGNSHLSKIDGSELKSLVDDKANFILIAHSSLRDTCTCWSEWHDNVLAPYIKKHNLLVYLVEMSEVSGEGKENYGLKLNAEEATLGIFKDGKLVYQHDTVDQNSAWVSTYQEFADWMNYRIVVPKVFYISLEQLDEKFNGTTEFTIYYSRSGCGDCSYFTNNYFKEYLISNNNVTPSFVLDCDVEGIRYVKGDDGKLYGPSNDENPNEYQLQASAKWNAFKEDYGMAYADDNVAGWNAGFVPTLFHINPNGRGQKRGDVIDGSMVIYNDKIVENKISDTYFTVERLETEPLGYLKESREIAEENKVLTGKSVGEQGDRKRSVYFHEELAPYHNAIAKAFLDAFIKN